jgi:hypothetical protein
MPLPNVSVKQDQQDALFAVSLLQIIPATCFEHLFARRQEVMNIQQLVYFGFGGLEVTCWPLVPKFGDSNPTKAVRFFRAKKSSACRQSHVADLQHVKDP